MSDCHFEVTNFFDHDVFYLFCLGSAFLRVVGNKGVDDIHGSDANLEIVVISEVEHAFDEHLRNL